MGPFTEFKKMFLRDFGHYTANREWDYFGIPVVSSDEMFQNRLMKQFLIPYFDILQEQCRSFEIEIDREAIKESFLNLPFLEWTYSTLSNGANFIGKLILVVVLTLFLLAGPIGKKKSETWENINKQVKKYIFAKFITSLSTGRLTGIIYLVF